MAQCSPPRFLAITNTKAPPNTSVMLNWTGANASPDSAITGYQIYRSTTENGTYTLHKTVTSSLTYHYGLVQTGATAGTVYWYKVLTTGTSAAYNSPLSLTAISLTTVAYPTVTGKIGKTNAIPPQLYGVIPIQPLSEARLALSGASVGAYALFAGGLNSSGVRVSTVDAYNESLTRSTPNGLAVPRSALAGSNTSAHALFAGGYSFSPTVSSVDAYDTALNHYNG